MSNYVSLVPAYGRDYNSKAAVLEAWRTGRDFEIRSFSSSCGTYANRESFPAGTTVNIRYSKLRKVCVITVR